MAYLSQNQYSFFIGPNEPEVCAQNKYSAKAFELGWPLGWQSSIITIRCVQTSDTSQQNCFDKDSEILKLKINIIIWFVAEE